ncbi:DUF6894 family protein [Mangrovicella endophytica]|uniref:DUF6894 family protein n=1 Tax=Mangrovicella endophytica TaxID=2066697 RepID=UPI000C9EB9D3|nr:hypothetical protein [Mangrovicella endophytica]
MPRFFIDMSDDETFSRDDAGLVFKDVEEAKNAAVATLADMAREALPDGDARTFLAIIRGEDGGMLLQANLTLKVTSLVPTNTR